MKKRKPWTEERRAKVRAAMLGKRNAIGPRSELSKLNISSGRRLQIMKRTEEYGEGK
jgi:hypothetical protein